MSIWRLLGVTLLLAVAGAAMAQVTCAQCKATALADASQCRAHAAPDSALLDTCDRAYAEKTQVCQDTACRAEAGAASAMQCADCAKSIEADLKKCATLPIDVRNACEARAAIARRMCEDKACPAAKK